MLSQNTHILLDAARLGDRINEAITLNPAHDSLYRGGPEQKLTSVAPYLFRFQYNTPFADWYMQEGWGKSWGVLFQASLELPDLYKHFRKFIKVDTEEGKQVFFRFYDPRVMRVFLQNTEERQLAEFFGPVQQFVMEDEDPGQVLRFSRATGILTLKRAELSGIYQPSAISNNNIQEEKRTVPEQEAIQNTAQPNVEATTPTTTTDLPTRKNSKWNMFD